MLLNLLNTNIEKKDNKKNKPRKMQPRPIKKLKHHKSQNIILNIKMSEHQIIEQSQSREQELHQRKALVNYHHSLQEKQHLEVKINQKMIILNRNTSLKENQVGREILKDHLLLKRITQKKKTHNMTPKRMRIEPEHIGEKQKEDI